MNTKMYVLFLCSLVSFSSFGLANERDFSIGLSLGPAIGFTSDFNHSHHIMQPQLNIGFDSLYQIPCVNGHFCKGVYIDFMFDYFLPTRYSFGSTKVFQTGLTGNYSKKFGSIGGSIGLRKHFYRRAKLQMVAGVHLGFQRILITDIQYEDALGQPLDIHIKGSSHNFSTGLALGLYYSLSHKLAFEIIPRLHLLIPSLFNNSYLEFPLSFKYTF